MKLPAWLINLLFLLALGVSGLLFPQTVKAATQIQNFTLRPTIPYIDTGIDVFFGDNLQIRRQGTGVIFVPGMTGSWVLPTGDPGCTAGPGYTLPGIKCWALVARIGVGQPFYVGELLNLTALQRGRLYLGINHQPPLTGSGGWNIQVIRNYVPPPPPPPPFLELPWDYEGKGLSFDEAGLSINSYFDHEYPLLSSSLGEPAEAASDVVSYEGIPNSEIDYSSHDGYDWGRGAGASVGEDVLAASDGCALYRSPQVCGACGNAIYIDHGNYYQTRYYHLQPDDLITTSQDQCVAVTQGQVIGKVGATGNSNGAHIHFMVVEDKNKDGDFDDNIPDGLTDPFGWQSLEADPWAEYTFNYLGVDREGNDSHYLWLQPIPNLSASLDSNGGFFQFQNLKLQFPAGLVAEDVTVDITPSPIQTISETLGAVGKAFEITVKNLFGTIISSFQAVWTVTVDFSDEDVSRFKPGTLSVYSSEDGTSWQIEETEVDLSAKLATASADHMSLFALLGELKDIEAPVTEAVIDGLELEAGVYVLPVTVALEASDLPASDDASGVDYTLYRLGEGEWQTYEAPLEATEAGNYILEYYSADLEENIEEAKQAMFSLQLAPEPTELMFGFNPDLLSIEATAADAGATITEESLGKKKKKIIATILGGTTTEVVVKEAGGRWGQSLGFETLAYGDEAVVDLPQATLSAAWIPDKRSKELLSLVQVFWVKDGDVVTLIYSLKKDETQVYIRLADGTRVQETLSGMRLLQVKTNEGSLEYSY
ncbi:MAG: M23 family metallopeptidase [Candidatus Chisholmbacteria bacterium]|nr:M23 family metallopeptidase [Candidatus Chisholmbacteria bacterium]